jgi:hypothetical protein
MNNLTKKAVIWSSTVVLLQSLVMGVGFSQSKIAEEKGPEISVKEISFLVRELPSTPSLLKVLEIHVEIYNKSRQATAPANSIKLVLVPVESKYAEGTSRSKFDLGQQETTVTVPLPPATGRIMTFGFSLPEKIPESVTFDIQVNPPEGEKKTATWESGKN